MQARIREAVRYLAALGESRSRYGLERISALVEPLGHPERDVPCVHVGGTNGKGSTGVMMASALQAAGLRTGLYTSPHLVSLCERVRVDGRDIAAEALAVRIEEVRALADRLPDDDRPTFFEVVTAAALKHFALERVDVAVLEVGLGGRLDATNIVERPLVSVLTRVSIDHTRFLGETLEAIAREKAGIVKPGRPVVSCWSEGPPAAVLAARCAELGAPLLLSGRDFEAEPGPARPDGTATFRFHGTRWQLDDLPLTLCGAHQVENAGLALAALERMAQGGLAVTPQAVSDGLASVRWPGRLERVVDDPPAVVLDGAHNPGAAATLAATLSGLYPQEPRVLLLGVSADKDVDRLLAPLSELCGTVVATCFGGSRALDAEALARAAGRRFTRVHTEPDPERALALAREQAAPAGLVLATGSLFLVGCLRGLLVGGEPGFRFA